MGVGGRRLMGEERGPKMYQARSGKNQGSHAGGGWLA